MEKALIGNLAHSGVVGSDVLSAVGCPPTGSALPGIEFPGFRVYAGVFQPPARCTVLWPLLTSRGISSSGSPQIRTRCFPTRPPHLPPRRNRPASLCGANSPYRGRPSMRFLFVGPSVSSSLPPPGRLPCRSWLRVVVLSRLHVWSSYRGLTPHLQRAHAGRTPDAPRYGAAAPPESVAVGATTKDRNDEREMVHWPNASYLGDTTSQSQPVTEYLGRGSCPEPMNRIGSYPRCPMCRTR